jgi:hypothetical protein
MEVSFRLCVPPLTHSGIKNICVSIHLCVWRTSFLGGEMAREMDTFMLRRVYLSGYNVVEDGLSQWSFKLLCAGNSWVLFQEKMSCWVCLLW